MASVGNRGWRRRKNRNHQRGRRQAWGLVKDSREPRCSSRSGSGHSVHHSGDPASKRVPGAHQVVISWQLEGSQVEVGGADNDRRVDAGSIPGSRGSPGGGKGSPLQYSCLENPMDRGAWQTTVHGVAKSQTRLSARAHHVYSFLLPVFSLHKVSFTYSKIYPF